MFYYETNATNKKNSLPLDHNPDDFGIYVSFRAGYFGQSSFFAALVITTYFSLYIFN